MTLLRAGSARGVFVSLPPLGSWQPRARHLCEGDLPPEFAKDTEFNAVQAQQVKDLGADAITAKDIAQHRGAEKRRTGDQF
jgi:hypothetical protein